MEFRFAVYREGPVWVAQGVEIDICTSAASKSDLPEQCALSMRLEDELPGGIARIAPPPQNIVALWEEHGGIAVRYAAIRKGEA